MRSNKEHKDCVKYKEEGYKGQDIMEGCSVQEEEEAELEDYQRPAECFHYLSDVCTKVKTPYIETGFAVRVLSTAQSDLTAARNMEQYYPWRNQKWRDGGEEYLCTCSKSVLVNCNHNKYV